MEQLIILLPIVAFVALAAGLVVVLRGTGRIVARTRELEQFKTAVRDLAARADASLGGAATQIDAVRRRQVGPETITDTVAAATDACERYTEEARALRGPSKARPKRVGRSRTPVASGTNHSAATSRSRPSASGS